MHLRDHPRLAGLRQRLLDHPLHAALRTADAVCIFAGHHVFCVWDFMSLLKALQAQLTCVRIPWVPTPDREARRLVNEIVLAEESDDDGQGGHASHFEIYLAAMRDMGASTRPFERFLSALREGAAVAEALRLAEVPAATASFVAHTLELARNAPPHRLAAAFALGREDIIPGLFVRLLEPLAGAEPARFSRFLYYLRRHVELDGDSHGPAALRLVEAACAGSPARYAEAVDTAAQCLQGRLAVWDEIQAALRG